MVFAVWRCIAFELPLPLTHRCFRIIAQQNAHCSLLLRDLWNTVVKSLHCAWRVAAALPWWPRHSRRPALARSQRGGTAHSGDSTYSMTKSPVILDVLPS